MRSLAGVTRRPAAAEPKEVPGRPSRPAPGAAAGTPLFLQTKLEVSEPGDAWEREADQAAATVMRMKEPGSSSCGPSCGCPDCGEARLRQGAPAMVQRRCAACDALQQGDDEGTHVPVLRQAGGGTAGASMAPSAGISATIASGGEPLHRGARDFFEPRFGRDFGDVRIHVGGPAEESARALGASAYTLGSHVVFNRGRYAPETTQGRHLLAHELAHVVQQDAAPAAALIRRQTEGPAAGGPAQCTSVMVELPSRVVFLGNRGPVAASLTTTVPPGDYRVTYSPAEGQFIIAALGFNPATPPRFEVSQLSDETLFTAYRESVTRQGIPLRVVGGPVGQPAVPDMCLTPSYVEALDDAELALHADVYRVRTAALGQSVDGDTALENLYLVQTEQLQRQAQDLSVVGEVGRPPLLPGGGGFVLQPAEDLPPDVAARIPEGGLITLPAGGLPEAGSGGGDAVVSITPLGADLQPFADPGGTGWSLRPTDVTTPLAVSSRTAIQSVNAGLIQQGFAAAGPDAIGLVGVPRWFTPGARVPEALLDTWGHTALYVRQGGRVTTVLGFNPQMGGGQLLPFLRNAGAIEAGTSAIPAAIGSDAYLFTMTGARSIEYPVSSATAEALMSRLPAPGPVAPGGATPPLYTARPAVYQVCTGSNCVLWAAEEAEAVLGGRIGPAAKGVSVTALGEGGTIVERTASQGRLMHFIRSVEAGETAIAPPAATGPPVAGGMSRGLQVLKWGGRVFFVIGVATVPLEVILAPSGSKARTAVGATGGFLGGLAAGATAGLVCGPGAPVCSVVLGLVFGIAGALGGRALFEGIYDAAAALSDSPGSILAPPTGGMLVFRGGYRGLLRSPADLRVPPARPGYKM